MNENCDYCGRDVYVAWRADPYAEEIEGDSTHYWLCDDCWGIQADEV